jgi:hypothetical protein
MSNQEADIPPYHGGPVNEPNVNDVLSGRGGRINNHSGNLQFRKLVKDYRGIYLSSETKKLDKVKVAGKIVQIIRNLNPSGRFLKEENSVWVEIGDEKARKKAGQAMREKVGDESRASSASTAKFGSHIHPQGHAQGHNTNPYFPSTAQQQPMQQQMQQQMQHPFLPQGATNMQPQSIHPMQNMYGFPVNNQNPNLVSSPVNEDQDSSLMVGRNAAFDREFNRTNSSSSRSLRMSSLGSSMLSNRSSMNTSNRSSLSSGPDNTKAAVSPQGQVQVQRMEPIHDDREESMTSGWDDTWDQEPISIHSKDSQSADTSVISAESERRKRFRNMKSEPSCLPSSLDNSGNVDQLNENDLMQESLVSVEMQSMGEMQPVGQMQPGGQTRKSAYQERGSIGDMRMDSVSECIVDTFCSDDVAEETGTSPHLASFRKNGTAIGAATGSQFDPVRETSNTAVEREISGILRNTARSSESRRNAFINNTTTMADLNLPADMSDIHQQRLFPDSSNRLSTNMLMSDINLSMNMLDLVDPSDDDDETPF